MDDTFDVASKTLLYEIKKALQDISYGSLEIIVQNGIVTQLTVRNIRKTSLEVQKKIVSNTHEKSSESREKINIKLRA